MDAIAEDLTLVRSTCLLTTEFAWLGSDPELDQKWEAALSGEADSLPSRAPSFQLALVEGVALVVRYPSNGPIDFAASISAPSVDREYQAALNAQLETLVKPAKQSQEEYPLFNLLSPLREWLTAHPAPIPAAPTSLPTPATPTATTLQLKVTLLWSHHLLAPSKRKDLLSLSHTYHLWGITRPGYPGVICVEGVAERVDEFVREVRGWQWKALQVRAEVLGEKVEVESGVSEKEGVEIAVRSAKLGGVLGGEGARVGAREVEDLGEVGELMRQAGLGDVFLSALKLAQ